MKVVFAGPSLFGSSKGIDRTITLRGPAGQGDIAAAVHADVAVIGIIDGVYEQVAAIWHKEILFALSQGVTVFGAASLGALRAVECAPFGMRGVGDIYEAYRSGYLVDDADVALLHAPAELGYRPLTEALVNVHATLEHHQRSGAISAWEVTSLRRSAESLFFKDRTWRAIIADAGLTSERAATVASLVAGQRVDRKRDDAERLLQQVAATPDSRIAPPITWRFVETSLFQGWLHPGAP